VVTVAVFVMVPAGAPLFTFTAIEKVALAPLTRVPMVQVVVPVPPPGGVEHENAGPAVCVSETNVVFAGTASDIETVSASDGPLFVTVTV